MLTAQKLNNVAQMRWDEIQDDFLDYSSRKDESNQNLRSKSPRSTVFESCFGLDSQTTKQKAVFFCRVATKTGHLIQDFAI